MHDSQFLTTLRTILGKEFVLSLEDAARADALRAHKIIRDHSGLKDRRRARGAEGQLRFRMMEEHFEEVCMQFGGHALEGGVITNTDLSIFQPFCRFECDGRGIILGLASMPEPKSLPAKNKSRAAGVSINYHLSPGLFDKDGVKVGDTFVLLLVARDRSRGGVIEELAIGVIDSKYESYLFYESLDEFVSERVDVRSEDEREHIPTVKLKKAIAPYVPPELGSDDKKRKSGNDY